MPTFHVVAADGADQRFDITIETLLLNGGLLEALAADEAENEIRLADVGLAHVALEDFATAVQLSYAPATVERRRDLLRGIMAGSPAVREAVCWLGAPLADAYRKAFDADAADNEFAADVRGFRGLARGSLFGEFSRPERVFDYNDVRRAGLAGEVPAFVLARAAVAAVVPARRLRSVFTCCAHEGHLEIMKLIFNEGIIEPEGLEIVFEDCVASSRRLDVLQWLWDAGARPRRRLDLECVVRDNRVDVLDWLEAVGAPVFSFHNIRAAAETSTLEVFRRFVVMLHADPHREDTPIICRRLVNTIADRSGDNIEFLQVLTEELGQVFIEERAFHIAAAHGRVGILARLVEATGAIPPSMTERLLELAEPPMASLEFLHARGALDPTAWDISSVVYNGNVPLLDWLWANVPASFDRAAQMRIWRGAARYGIIDILRWITDKAEPENIMIDGCIEFHPRTLDFLWDHSPVIREPRIGRQFVNELACLDMYAFPSETAHWILRRYGRDVFLPRGEHPLLKRLAAAAKEHEAEFGRAWHLAHFVLNEVYDDEQRASARQCAELIEAGFFRETRSTRKRPREH